MKLIKSSMFKITPKDDYYNSTINVDNVDFITTEEDEIIFHFGIDIVAWRYKSPISRDAVYKEILTYLDTLK